MDSNQAAKCKGTLLTEDLSVHYERIKLLMTDIDQAKKMSAAASMNDSAATQDD